ncbi:MAG TPA: glycosyltransferase family 1 protein [Terriglobia bacterium]|nr:glycosyltransferase family 1 protein [Terriglobia bacterium]
MRILMHALTAKMGGAGNYIRTLAHELAEYRQHDFLFLVPESQAAALPRAPNLSVLSKNVSGLRRLWFDQVALPRLIRRERIDVLFSTANFATFFCPCRQLLLMRNSLYFSPLYRDFIVPYKTRRARVTETIRRFLARRSAKVVDVVLTPSKAMAYELQAALDVPAKVNYYGVDTRRFHPTPHSFAPGGRARLLFTSLYAEHKNLRTLFRALVRLNDCGHNSFLITTADPSWEKIHNPIRHFDRVLAGELARRRLLELTGVLTGAALDQLYGRADIFVYPSIIESFGHPLLEAMAFGLPVVAADVPVNRELCADAALYFTPFDDVDCARQIGRVIDDAELRRRLAEAGLRRAQKFSWSAHAQMLIEQFAGTPELLTEPVESTA